MNLIKSIEIIEYFPRSLKFNYSMETISSKLIDCIKDIYIKRLISPETYDTSKIPYQLFKKEVSLEYNSNLKQPINENEIYWGVRIKVTDFKYSNNKLKPKNYCHDDLMKNKIAFSNYDSFLNQFFVKNEKWNFIENNLNLHVNTNEIANKFTKDAIFYETIFKWQLFDNSVELKNDLKKKTGENITPILQIYPLLPISTSQNDIKSKEKYKYLIENLSSNYLNNLFDEFLEISKILSEFNYFYIQGPYFTFENDLQYWIEDKSLKDEWFKYIEDSGYYDSNFK